MSRGDLHPDSLTPRPDEAMSKPRVVHELEEKYEEAYDHMAMQDGMTVRAEKYNKLRAENARLRKALEAQADLYRELAARVDERANAVLDEVLALSKWGGLYEEDVRALKEKLEEYEDDFNPRDIAILGGDPTP